jgi:hypothetical protein
MIKQMGFSELAALINQSRSTRIDLTPVNQHRAAACYRAEDRVRGESFPFMVIYLQADATNAAIAFAARESRAHSRVDIVYPPTLATLSSELKERAANAAEAFSKSAKFWTTKEYLLSFITHELESYIARLREQKPPFYTDPPVEVPAGFRRRIPNPLFSFLTDPDPGSGIKEGAIGVLLAEPGQGKTYLSRYLVSHICETKTGLTPILVDSTQWETIATQDLASFWKTIAHSFRYFEASIGWLEGNEDMFLRTSLKAGIFRIVFDGFDEYILRNRGKAQPLDVLNALSDLAAGTGARILVTSRTSFWHQSLSEEEYEDFIADTHSYIYRLLPFDVSHAANYFRARLRHQGQIDRATALYGTLRPGNEELVGRGFVLSLVADLIERSDGKSTGPSDKSNALLWLLEALCQREEIRQRLPIDSTDQGHILRMFAKEIACGEPPNTELLDYCTGVVASNLDSATRQQCLAKLASHPIISKEPNDDKWRFNQKQVEIVLLADLLLQEEETEFVQFIRQSTLSSSQQQDLAGMIVDLIMQREKEAAALERIARLIRPMTVEGVTTARPSKLGAAICLLAVDRFRPRGRERQERIDCLCKLVGGKQVEGLHFSGTLASLHLDGITFRHCAFERVAWVNCSFSENTIFQCCQFLGGAPPVRCQGFAGAERRDCRLDHEAKALLDAVSVTEGKKRYSEVDLRNDIKSVLDKFTARGGLGLRSVKESHLRTGPIGVSQHGTEVIRELAGTVLETHQISGVSEPGYNVRESAQEAVKFFATNNVFTGDLQTAFDKLKKKLGV